VAKRLPLAVPTPPGVYEATQAFGTELRVHLIRYYAANPEARQADAFRALGVERAVVSFNTRALVDTGVLVPRDGSTYAVDEDRFHELLKALADFGPGPSSQTWPDR
jgi:hypothetical protein